MNKTKKKYVAGGAANVACNLASLGIETTLLTICGRDKEAENLENLLNKKEIDTHIIQSTNSPTITKTRFLSGGHQLLRTDNEITFSNSESKALDSEQIVAEPLPVIQSEDITSEDSE